LRHFKEKKRKEKKKKKKKSRAENQESKERESNELKELTTDIPPTPSSIFMKDSSAESPLVFLR